MDVHDRHPVKPQARTADYLPRPGLLAVVAAIGLVIALLPLRPVSAAAPSATQPATTGDTGAQARVKNPTPAAKGKLKWAPCATEDSPDQVCASVKVPRDYANPDGPKFKIAMTKIPATGAAQERIGTLFWDAGGPGGVSTGMAGAIVKRMSPQIREQFDFVAFDPRGIGRSIPALTEDECLGPWPVRPASKAEPNWFRVQRNSAGVLAPDNRECLSSNRSFVNDMGTNNVARDLDRLRKAVGDARLTFWATSYGTRIGYVYALMFPQKVRAIVMDGSIDPSGDFAGLAEDGGLSQDSALQFMKNNYRSGYDAIMDTAQMLTAKPVRLDDGSTFSRWDWLDVAGDQIPFQDSWPAYQSLADKIPLAYGNDDVAARVRAQLADLKARPNSNEGGGFSTVNCLDYADRPGNREQGDIITDNAHVAPVFGGSLSTMYAIGCAGLAGVTADPVPSMASKANRAKVTGVPVLLANSTKDGATPLVWAKSMRKAFGKPPIIKYKSGQHVIWGATGSTCVNQPIDRFVLSQRLPKQSRTCAFVPPKGQ